VFAEMATTYAGLARFAIVYINEAHADDSLGARLDHNAFVMKQHVELSQRITAAGVLAKHIETHLVGQKDGSSKGGGEKKKRTAGSAPEVYVDSMSDTAQNAYGALPERLYVLQNGKIAYRGGTGPFHYDLYEAETELRKLVGGSETKEGGSSEKKEASLPQRVHTGEKAFKFTMKAPPQSYGRTSGKTDSAEKRK
jgi:hypothetical protein